MNKATVKTEYHIHRFMYELGIKGSALVIYAALYSFSMGERGLYHGSQKYLAESVGVSVRTVQNALKRLFSLSLIERYETEDGRYRGIRCAMPQEEKEESPSIDKKEESVCEFSESVCEASESVSARRGGLSEEAAEQIRRVDELCAKMQEKIKRLNAEREAEKERRPAVYIPEDAPPQEKNTLLMMQRYEKRGDNRRFLEFGKDGSVRMTEPQYKRLLDLLPTEELMPYFMRFEVMLKENERTGKRPPHSHYKTLKKWIEEDLSL